MAVGSARLAAQRIADEAPAPSGFGVRTLLDPQALYELWERQHWAAHAIDLRADREQWRSLPRGLRERLTWHIAAFFVGEERVAVELGALLRAHESPAEAAFLATQQVDEARHTQHFDRFYRHVLEDDGGFDAHLRAARAQIGEPLVELLDDYLTAASERLRRDPADEVAKVEFVVLYHMVIEGMLALTGQEVLLGFLERRGLLAGWCEGLRLIAQDEHRHVAYGAWLLQRKAQDPGLRRHIGERLAQLVPLALDVLVPPGARPEYFRPLDRSGVAVRELALRGLRRRLGAIGLDPAPAAAALPVR
jgi:ribonucleoside-diphosphate reductase beta chain